MEKHGGHDATSAQIAEHARAAAGESSASDDSYTSLKTAVEAASPDERSAAAMELSEEMPAYETLHRALQELGIEE